MEQNIKSIIEMARGALGERIDYEMPKIIKHMRKQLWSDKREETEKEARLQDLKLRSELLRQYKKEKEAQTGGTNEERNGSIKSP